MKERTCTWCEHPMQPGDWRCDECNCCGRCCACTDDTVTDFIPGELEDGA